MTNFKVTEISSSTAWDNFSLEYALYHGADFTRLFEKRAKEFKARFVPVLGESLRRTFEVQGTQNVGLDKINDVFNSLASMASRADDRVFPWYRTCGSKVIRIAQNRMLANAQDVAQVDIRVRKAYDRLHNPHIVGFLESRTARREVETAFNDNTVLLSVWDGKRIKSLPFGKYMMELLKWLPIANKEAHNRVIEQFRIELSKIQALRNVKTNIVVSAEANEIISCSMSNNFTSCHDLGENKEYYYGLGNFQYIADRSTFIIKAYSDLGDEKSCTFRAFAHWNGVELQINKGYGHNIGMMVDKVIPQIIAKVFGYGLNDHNGYSIVRNGRNFIGYNDGISSGRYVPMNGYKADDSRIEIGGNGYLSPSGTWETASFMNVDELNHSIMNEIDSYEWDDIVSKMRPEYECEECGCGCDEYDMIATDNGTVYCGQSCLENAIIENIRRHASTQDSIEIANILGL